MWLPDCRSNTMILAERRSFHYLLKRRPHKYEKFQINELAATSVWTTHTNTGIQTSWTSTGKAGWLPKRFSYYWQLASKPTLRCKPEIDVKIVQKEMKFKYLEIKISGLRGPTTKTSITAACLNSFIQNNKHLRIEDEATIRLMLTYNVQVRPETGRKKRMLEITEIKVIGSRKKWEDEEDV